MSNRDRVRRAYGALQPSRDYLTEVEKMTEKRRHYGSGLLAAALMIAGATAAYAADLGGIRQTVRLWWNGSQVEVNVDKETQGDGEWYVLTNPDGSTRHIEAAVGQGEKARELDLDDLQSALEYDPDVRMEDDGRIWFILRTHRIDITDQIEETGYYAHVFLEDGEWGNYITVVWDKETDQVLCISPGREDFPDAEILWKNLQG